MQNEMIVGNKQVSSTGSGVCSVRNMHVMQKSMMKNNKQMTK